MSRYQPGDWVYPTDLPRPVLCRVVRVERLGHRAGRGQILGLAPFEGPWPIGTQLVRLDDQVRPVAPRQLWQAGAPTPRPRGPRPGARRLTLEQHAA